MPVLECHPSTPCAALTAVTADARWWPDGTVRLRYVLEGRIKDIKLPVQVQSRRADELWRHTCCEAFVAVPGLTGYSEFNFSPSGAWAAYRFSGYREGMHPLDQDDPAVNVRSVDDRFALDAVIGLGPEPRAGKLHVGLTVVVEEQTGALSYWALAHPGPRPDFHNADGFRLVLGAPIPEQVS